MVVDRRPWHCRAMEERPDVIVVGGGSSGAVICRRLVDAGRRVLLLEAGGPDEYPAIHVRPAWASCGIFR